MKSIFYLVFLLLSFSAQSECEKMSFSSVDTDYEGVNYGLSDVIVTSKGRTFFMISHSKNVNQKKFSLLMVIKQYHMHHIMASNI